MEKREEIQQEQNQKIDLVPLFIMAWRQFRKTWWFLILLCVSFSMILCAYTTLTYTPVYTAYSSFAVDSGAGTTSYYSRLTRLEIAETLPYILESGALQYIVMEQLDVDTLDAEISATVLTDTSLLQISVSAGDPDYAYAVLEAVIENYPSVARYVIGEAELTLLDSSGVPSGASNGYSYRSLAKRGCLLAAVVYLCVLAVLTLIRRTVMSEKDLKKNISIVCLANIPLVRTKRRSKKKKTYILIDRKNVNSNLKESVNMLRIRTKRQMEKNEAQILLMTSTGEGEGKTTLAANLSLSFAQKGYRVLLIDADLRNPSVAAAFGQKPGSGIVDVLNGDVALSEALIRYTKGMYLLSGRAIADRSRIAAVLGDENLKIMLKELKKSFDYIIIDTPPCGLMPDAIMLAPICDEAVMVVKQDYIEKDRVLAAIESLVNTGICMAGFVINGEKTGIGSYGYGYGRYGYGHYGYGYGYGRKRSGRSGYGYGSQDGGEVYDPDRDVKKPERADSAKPEAAAGSTDTEVLTENTGEIEGTDIR